MSLPNQPDPLRHVLAWPQRGVEMAFRLIPAGMFRMGSRGNYPDEEPGHLVKIVQPFWLAETPVTQAQFALWTESEGIEHENNFKDHSEHPAENMDWRQAMGFCRWLTGVQAGKLPTAPHGDWFAGLPTEAEWEYACRAGTETDYYSGDGEAALAEAGWFGEDYTTGSTHPVAKKQPNGFGLFDLHGNVWEWCHDGWDAAAYRRLVEGDGDPWHRLRAEDYVKPWEELLQDSRRRVIRGGSWGFGAGAAARPIASGTSPMLASGTTGSGSVWPPGPAAVRHHRQIQRRRSRAWEMEAEARGRSRTRRAEPAGGRLISLRRGCRAARKKIKRTDPPHDLPALPIRAARAAAARGLEHVSRRQPGGGGGDAPRAGGGRHDARVHR